MSFFKANKIFISLISVLALCILFLFARLYQEKQTVTSPSTWKETNNTTTIEKFAVTLDTALDLNFRWNINRGSEVIAKMELYHNGYLFQDVTDKAAYTISLFESGMPTGNNEFTFKITFDNGNFIEKNIYYYIDEVLGFKVTSERDGNIIRYTAAYFQDKNTTLLAPQVQMSYDQNIGLTINYMSNTKLSERQGFVEMKAVYELDLSQAPSGTYQVRLNFRFDDYNLNFEKVETIQI